MVKKIWHKIWHDVLSRVIAGVILAILAVIWTGLHWSALAATWPVPSWLLGLLGLLILAPTALLYRTIKGTLHKALDELEGSKREVVRLKEELKAEKNSLQDCPQVVIKFEESESQRAVVVHNVSKTVDAFDIEMDPVDGHDVRLVSRRIDHLKAGEVKRLELSAARIRKRAGLPELPAISEVSIFFEEAADKTPFSSVDLTVHYRDATSNKKCISTATLTWYILPKNHLAGVEFHKVSCV